MKSLFGRCEWPLCLRGQTHVLEIGPGFWTYHYVCERHAHKGAEKTKYAEVRVRELKRAA